MKKTIAILMVFIILLSTVPAFAADVRTSGLYTYEIKGNGTVTITGFNWDKNSGDVFIPNMIDGYTVSEIGNEAFKYTKNEQGVQVTVTLPDTVKRIGDFAFWGTGLTGINIPNTVQFIGKGAFVGCRQCQFKISPDHSKYAVIDNTLYDKSKKELLATGNMSNTLVIPEGIRSIGDYALYQGGNWQEGRGFILPSTLETIGDYAFFGYELSPSLYLRGERPLLNDGLISIGDYAFSEASFNYGSTYGGEIYTVVIPDSVQEIGVGCFSNITSRTYASTHSKIEIGEKSQLHEIPQDAFRNSDLNITVNGKIRAIGSYAFSCENSDPSVTVNDLSCVEEIAEGAFWDASNSDYNYNSLSGYEHPSNSSTPLLLSDSITTLPKHFNLYGSLPNTVTCISSEAYTKPVSNFLLPESIESIEDDAFPKGSSFIVTSGSYAEFWCVENGFAYTIEGQDNLDWLNS